MEKITFKMRFFAFFFIAFILAPLCAFLVYIFFYNLNTWSGNPDVLVFSSVSISAGVIAPLFFIVFIIISIQPILKARRASDTLQAICSKLIYLLLLVGILINFGFKYYYTEKLTEQGYLRCKGVPNSSMLGMAAKYAKSESLCNLK
ncbi:DUF1240 domain-containing protein [Serratia sp. DD3]|uniref:DUF1240 domain-containing protein n=1 Tax=Serratia sp. DD3 TaxID=1410619 RepID=UPI0003C4E308|nr:DUF1240 domain-containing protein [Serratia sp. DD3]KEY58039.1 hypothetical protein SRDD_30270 [Serratia sp. DD3]